MVRALTTFSMFALMLLASGCAVAPRCGTDCSVGDCSLSSTRARNPIEQLRYGMTGGGCGEIYWGEPLYDCDSCNIRPGSAAGLAGLLGVRRHGAAVCSECGGHETGCSSCGGHSTTHSHAMTTEVMGEPIHTERTVPQANPQGVPQRQLPGPESGAQRSIMRPRTTSTRSTPTSPSIRMQR